MSRDIRRIGVVGLGTMGAGIAEVFASHGFDVVGIDANDAAVERGRGHVEGSTARAVKRGKATEEERAAILGRIRFGTELSELADRDLVVEAVSESLDLKRGIFEQLDAIVGPDAILATNTSSLSVTDIAVATGRPAQVVGMHFFNPAPVLKFVEVVRTVVSAPDVVEDVEALASSLDKLPVVVDDKAGFIANALLFGYLNHAVSMFETKYATREDIDASMKLGCGLPMGPLALLDLIGLDTAYEILDTMYKQGRDRLHAPSPALKQMVTAGLRGRKTGRGFYTYEAPNSPVVIADALTPVEGAASDTPLRQVDKVGVVGSGTMATGIIEVFAKAGIPVLYVARGDDKVARVRTNLERSLDKGVLRGKLTQEERDGRARAGDRHDELDDLADVDLVVEAVVEDLAVKTVLFEALDEICKPGAILATTTSSLSVVDLAAVTKYPAGRRGPALLQPRADHEAGRGRLDRGHRGRRRGHRRRPLQADRQAPGDLRRPGRLHRQRAAVPVPQRRRPDARGQLRHGRRHRHRHEDRLRLPDGSVRAARRRRPRCVSGHPAHAVPRVPRAGLRPGAAARAPRDGRLPRPQDRPRVPHLRSDLRRVRRVPHVATGAPGGLGRARPGGATRQEVEEHDDGDWHVRRVTGSTRRRRPTAAPAATTRIRPAHAARGRPGPRARRPARSTAGTGTRPAGRPARRRRAPRGRAPRY